jgi:lysozyme
MTLLLCDLSNNNPPPIVFGQIRQAGVFGLWHKVTESLNFTDRDWQARSTAARAAGLRVGGYHFARPSQSVARAQAEYFVEHLGKVQRRDLRPVLDLEDDGKLHGAELWTWAREFLAHVHARTGVRALTYSGPSFIARQKWPRTFGTGAGLWLAEYGPNDGHDHGYTVPAPWTTANAHQYTSVGKLAGVAGHVDLSHATRRTKILAHPLRGLL